MKLLLTTLFIFCTVLVSAQDAPYLKPSKQQMEVRLKSGNQLVGEIISETSTSITLHTNDMGDVTLQRDQIDWIRSAKSKRYRQGNGSEHSAFYSRYFYGASGYNLRKGEGYYQNSWIFFNQVSYGVTNHFTMGVGFMPLFLLGGGPTPVWITPKVNLPIKSENFQFGLGALAGTILGGDVGGFGIAYASATVGKRDRNLSVSLGYGQLDGDWANKPTISISGMYRVSPKVILLTENYFFSGDENTFVLPSAGLRFLLGGVGLDAGLIFPTVSLEDSDNFFALPWLSVTIPFGRSR